MRTGFADLEVRERILPGGVSCSFDILGNRGLQRVWKYECLVREALASCSVSAVPTTLSSRCAVSSVHRLGAVCTSPVRRHDAWRVWLTRPYEPTQQQRGRPRTRVPARGRFGAGSLVAPSNGMAAYEAASDQRPRATCCSDEGRSRWLSASSSSNKRLAAVERGLVLGLT